MLAIDIMDSDILSTATHDPRGPNRVRVAAEDAGLRVRQIAPSESDRRTRGANGSPTIVVTAEPAVLLMLGRLVARERCHADRALRLRGLASKVMTHNGAGIKGSKQLVRPA
jgi:hypothetical protein